MTDSSQPADLLPEFRIGNVLGQTFRTFFANFFKFVVLGALLFAPMTILTLGFGLMAPTMVDPATPPDATSFFTIFTGTFLLMIATVTFVFSAITYGSIEHLAGHEVTLGGMAKRGLKAMVPVILSYLMIMPLYLLGVILLIIPGIIVLIMFSMTAPIIVAEGLGPIAAMRRSRELTGGYKWHLLAIFFLIGLIIQLGQFLLMIPMFTAVSAGSSEVFGILFGVGSTVLGGIYYALMGTCVASIYTSLRETKEGTSADKIAEVFA